MTSAFPPAAPPAASAASGSTLQSSRVSLISKSEIRYEGTLHSINPSENTVALRGVQMFGTEGRKEGQQIPPADQLYEFIIFRGSDIKDLTVYDVAQQQATPPAPQMPPDPAIISGNVWANQQAAKQAAPSQQQPGWDRSQAHQQYQQQRRPPGQGWEDRGYGYDQQQWYGQQQRQRQWQPEPAGRGYGGPPSSLGRGRGGGHTGQDFRPPASSSTANETFKEDYDFETANRRIAGDDKTPKENPEGEADSGPKYDSGKSFFDDLSTNRTLPTDQGPRMTRQQRRQQDLETFGDLSLNDEVGYGYGGGGGGGRGRGGFQQGGRGGYAPRGRSGYGGYGRGYGGGWN
eukprot:TRINITY_DN7946_c0_g1_i1.p1 TRINITY_DN7946_c0_g1~~TRINITY_DN7946_c0_g1_i1.p1  ORF type:complete len:346 (-),score=29.40 TRINITY_DN7946_c0_g1_i1:196-1233(-)